MRPFPFPFLRTALRVVVAATIVAAGALHGTAPATSEELLTPALELVTDLTGQRPDGGVLAQLRAAVDTADERVPVIVEFRTDYTPDALLSSGASIAQLDRITALQDGLLSRLGSPVLRHRFSTPAMSLAVTVGELDILAAAPEVARVHPVEFATPTDLAAGATAGYAEAQRIEFDGEGENVAILDTGVDANHEYLQGRVVSEACFAKQPTDGTTMQIVDGQVVKIQRGRCPNGRASQTGPGSAVPCRSLCDHGTHVAGIAAGDDTTRLVNGSRVGNGVAPRAGIIAVQIFSVYMNVDCDRNGSIHTGESCARSANDDQMAALEWLYTQRNNMRIAAANLSLGFMDTRAPALACNTDPLKPVIDKLRAAGIATVIAAGNDGSTRGVSHPGCISTAITVGATDNSDRVASFTNASPNIDLWAPGVGVLSSTTAPATYGLKDGTSMAAPHVAGAFALLRQQARCGGLTATVNAFEQRLESTGKPITDPRNASDQQLRTTAPRLDVYAALKSGDLPTTSDYDKALVLVGARGKVSKNNNCATKEVQRGTVGFGEGIHAGNRGGASIWFEWTAPETGLARFSTLRAEFDTLLAAYLGTAQVVANDNVGFYTGSRILIPALKGQTYLIAVDGKRRTGEALPAMGTVQLEWSQGVPVNDERTSPTVLSGASGTLTGTTARAMSDPPEAPGRSVWFTWTPKVAAMATISTAGSAFDTVLDVELPTGQRISNNDGGPGTTSLVQFPVTANSTYVVRLAGNGDIGGNYTFTYSLGSGGK